MVEEHTLVVQDILLHCRRLESNRNPRIHRLRAVVGSFGAVESMTIALALVVVALIEDMERTSAAPVHWELIGMMASDTRLRMVYTSQERTTNKCQCRHENGSA